MRLIVILVLTGFLALWSLPGMAMAHGGETSAAAVATVPDCLSCTEAVHTDTVGDQQPQTCPHLTSCAAMVLIDLGPGLAQALAPKSRHGLPPALLLSGRATRIDLPPPRLRA